MEGKREKEPDDYTRRIRALSTQRNPNCNDNDNHNEKGETSLCVIEYRPLRGGKLLSWGNNECGELGIGSTFEDARSRIFLVDKGSVLPTGRIVSISSGSYHSAAITTKGEIATWGDNSNGQLGHGNTDGLSSPQIIKGTVLDKIRIVKVACSYQCTCALDAGGSLYYWGKWDLTLSQGGSGEDNEDKKCLIPCKIASPGVAFIDIQCGYFHAVALTHDRQVYIWGRNSYGQLGQGDNNDQLYEPKLVDLPADETSFSVGDSEEKIKVKQIATSGFAPMLLLSNGKILACGAGVQNGLDTSDPVRAFCQVKGDLENVAVEKVFSSPTARQVFAIDSGGLVYGWGYGGCYCLGTGNENNLPKPTLIKSLNSLRSPVRDIALGGRFSIVTTCDNRFFVFGKSDRYQLGLDSMEDVKMPRPLILPPEMIEDIDPSDISIKCGRNFAIALALEGPFSLRKIVKYFILENDIEINY